MKNFDLEEIKRVWTPAVGDKIAERDVWDRNSVTYRDRPMPTPENDMSMKCLADHQMLTEDSVVLDVGCGGGLYSVPIARQCKHLVGTDVSPEMLKTAAYNTERYGVHNTEFHLIDWHSFELPEDWNRRFDLVFANLTPAVQSYHTLDLMNRASKKWCFLSKPVEWKNSLVYEVVDKLGLTRQYRTFDEDMLFAFNVLRLEGYTPHTCYKRMTWHSSGSLEKTILDISDRIEMKVCLNEAQKKRIPEIVAEYANQGLVESTTDVVYAGYCWRVDHGRFAE